MASEMFVEKIKRRLGIPVEDDAEDDLISDLIEDAKAYFSSLTGSVEVPAQYDFIIRNVVVKMYGRKGSEAVRSEKVDGHLVTYEGWDDLFKPYMKILNKDFGLDGSLRESGEVFVL